MVNEQILYDGPVEENLQLNFDIFAHAKNTLTIAHYGKRFGDEGIYDCNTDKNQDCVLKINDIKFQNITIGKELMSKLYFETVWTPAQLRDLDPKLLEQMSRINSDSTVMNFNSVFNLNFEIPILNWLTIAKYKTETKPSAYFSNYSLRWHYEEDLKLIEEIKSLLKK